MHVLAFVNQKGGCGKTTTAVNLAGALSAKGQRVLVVDLDPQAHATLGLGCAVENEPSMIEVLTDRAPLKKALTPVPGGFKLAPATARLAEFEEQSARMLRPEQMLDRALETVDGEFDFALLDCPPRADGVLTANALRASDTALLIVECGAFALQGAMKATRIFEELMADMGHELRVRVVGTLFDRRTKFARELLIAMHSRFGRDLFDTAIRTSVRLREAAACGVPVQVLDPGCRSTTEFAALADEVIEYDQERNMQIPRRRPVLAASPADFFSSTT